MKMTLEKRKKWLEDNSTKLKELNSLAVKEKNEQTKAINKKSNKYNEELKTYSESKSKDVSEYLLPIYPYLNEEDEYDKLMNSYNQKSEECIEQVKNINISNNLEEIRHDIEKENAIVLFIKNNEVVDAIHYTENKMCRVDLRNIEQEIINKSKVLNADICMVHNHPLMFAATPSKSDLLSYAKWKKELASENITLIDYGIVTKDDYWSYENEAEKMIKNIKATLAMEDLYLTEADVEGLRVYRGDGGINDQKIIEEIIEKYKDK